MPYVLEDLSKYVLTEYSSNRESITKKKKKLGKKLELFLYYF